MAGRMPVQAPKTGHDASSAVTGLLRGLDELGEADALPQVREAVVRVRTVLLDRSPQAPDPRQVQAEQATLLARGETSLAEAVQAVTLARASTDPQVVNDLLRQARAAAFLEAWGQVVGQVDDVLRLLKRHHDAAARDLAAQVPLLAEDGSQPQRRDSVQARTAWVRLEAAWGVLATTRRVWRHLVLTGAVAVPREVAAAYVDPLDLVWTPGSDLTHGLGPQVPLARREAAVIASGVATPQLPNAATLRRQADELVAISRHPAAAIA